VTRPDATGRAKDALAQFLAEGQHGDMDWLAATAERRGDPRTLWPDVRAVVMLGVNYGPAGDPLAIRRRASAARSRSTRRATTTTT
jgi:epoxyqueuosine reductase